MRTNLLMSILLVFSIHLSAQINLQLDLLSDAFTRVVDITNAGDDRLFIVEQAGQIQIIQSDGSINATPFLDIDTQVASGGERGLLGLAFHPDYASNGYFFVSYTNNDGNSVISRFEVSAGDPDLADPSSELILFTIDQPYSNHNGGDLAFGPDGYLYISSGDGGDGGDPLDKGQDLTTLLGKMLRIDVDNDNTGNGYAIPPDNPFADGAGGNADEIWALGLRNPWRFSFDRHTGDMWIGDVGQESWEEINFEAAGSAGGLNYGWRCYEGDDTYNTTDCGPVSQYTFPVHAYDHDLGCSVNGGFVYRGHCPTLYGLYLFSDYCSGRIWSLQEEDNEWVTEELFQDTDEQFVTMGEDHLGELYLGSLGGSVYRITDTSCNGDCSDLIINNDPIPADTYQAGTQLTSGGTVESGTSVTFKAEGSLVLRPGFHAESGSDFQAMIESCTAPASALAKSPAGDFPDIMPASLQLDIYPNPSRSATTIRYTLPQTAKVEIQVWDIYGQLMARSVTAQQDAGSYQRSITTAELPAGNYLIVLRADGIQQIGRMEVVR